MVEEQANQRGMEHEVKSARLSKELARIEREIQNLLKFIREGVSNDSLRVEFNRLEQSKTQVLLEMDSLQKCPSGDIVLPTAEDLRSLAREEFKELALESFEFATLMRRLIPKIVVFPYRDCLGGTIVIKSKFRLQMAEILPLGDARNMLSPSLEKLLQVDLFEPIQRVKFREQIVELISTINPKTNNPYSIKDAANIVLITATAAQRAVKLQQQMDRLGLTDPFVRMTEPDGKVSKLRRHLHDRYKFDPLDHAGDI